MVRYATIEGKNEFVKTCISMPKEQAQFLKEYGYSASRLFQNQVSKLMEKSEGQTLREQPTDEPQEGDRTHG